MNVSSMDLTPPNLLEMAQMGSDMVLIAKVLTSFLPNKNVGPVNDPEVEAARKDLIETFVSIGKDFRAGVAEGEVVADYSSNVAQGYISLLQEVIDGKSTSQRLADHTDGLVDAVEVLLEKAKGMQKCFQDVETGFGKLGKQQEEELGRAGARTEYAAGQVEGGKVATGFFGIIGGMLGGLALAAASAPVAIPALTTLGLAAMFASDIDNDKKKLAYNEDFVKFLNEFGAIVMQAGELTTVQVLYWSKILKSLRSLQTKSTTWSRRQSTVSTEKLLAQWRQVDEMYTECSTMAMDARRLMDVHFQITM